MAVSKRTRFEVLRRDDHTCRYCGASAPDVKLHVDHVTPVSLGGTDNPDNLVAACIDCNFGKSSSSPDAAVVDGVAQDAAKWADAVQRAADLVKADKAAATRYRNAFKRRWDSYCWGANNQWTNDLPLDWRQSVESFRQAGLSIEQLKDAVDVACNNGYLTSARVFRYMCGVAWKKLREQQDIAKKLLGQEGDGAA